MLQLKKGINLGGWFSQCKVDENHYKTFINSEDIRWIKEHSFDHVRIPVDYEFFETEAGDSIHSHFELLNDVIGWCDNYDLKVILDLHKAYGYDFNTASKDNKDPLFSDRAVQERYLNLWRKIAEYYSNYSFVAFELLNEIVNIDYVDGWNKLSAEAIKTIRGTGAKNTIIYGGVLWNSAKTVKLLNKPKDDNVILTFHYYEPLLFTHQRAYWVKNMPEMEIKYPGKTDWYKQTSKPIGLQAGAVLEYNQPDIGKEFHRSFIQDAIDAAEKLGVPLYCGEFGVIDRAPIESTVNWFKDVTEVFKEYDIGYSLWSYKEMDFGIVGDHYKQLSDTIKNL